MLRNTLVLIKGASSIEEIIRYAAVYTAGSGKLVDLLKNEARLVDDKAAQIDADIHQAIAELTEE